MKITCLQETLNANLNIVSRAVTARPVANSSAQDILLEESDGRLKLSAGDLDAGVFISVWLNAKVEDAGPISLPARVLKELVNQLPKGEISIETQTKPLGATIKRGSISAQIYGHIAEDFPTIPEVTDGVMTKFRAEDLNNSLKRILMAISKEDSRPILTGAQLELENDKFTFASADGYRLAVENNSLMEAVKDPISVVIPEKALRELRGLLEGSQADVQFQVTENQSQAMFKFNDLQLVTSLMQGKFPNYSSLLPRDPNTQIELSLEELRRAVKISTAFVHDTNGTIRLIGKTGDDGAILSVISQSEDIGENQVDIKAKITGDEIKCAFNYRFLNELLDNLEGETIIFATQSASSAGLFKSTAITQYDHVIMPMFVQW